MVLAALPGAAAPPWATGVPNPNALGPAAEPNPLLAPPLPLELLPPAPPPKLKLKPPGLPAGVVVGNDDAAPNALPFPPPKIADAAGAAVVVVVVLAPKMLVFTGVSGGAIDVDEGAPNEKADEELDGVVDVVAGAPNAPPVEEPAGFAPNENAPPLPPNEVGGLAVSLPLS